MLGLFALLGLSYGDPGATREASVLALLDGVAQLGTFRYGGAFFEEVEPRLGAGPVVVARESLYCANSDGGTFDDERARRIASECMRIYGFEVTRDHLIFEGDRGVRIDGLDLQARVGFELVGRGCHKTFCDVKPEAPEVGLDAIEARWLADQGYRLHVADVAQYRQSGDEFTQTLAYIAGFIRFLNVATEGEDVDLGGLLFEREAAWEIPGANGRGEIVVERPTTIRFECSGAPDLSTAPKRYASWFFGTQETTQARRDFTTTQGAASVLLFPGAAVNLVPHAPRPEFRVRVRQTTDGVEHLREAAALAVLLTRDFDLMRPFEVELELSPGRYVLVGPALIGASWAARSTSPDRKNTDRGETAR